MTELLQLQLVGEERVTGASSLLPLGPGAAFFEEGARMGARGRNADKASARVLW